MKVPLLTYGHERPVQMETILRKLAGVVKLKCLYVTLQQGKPCQQTIALVVFFKTKVS